MKLLFTLAVLLFAPLSAMAQCVGTNGINTIANCPDAVSPQSTDYLLSYQNSQSPHTRKMTLSQIAGGSSVTSVGLSMPSFFTVTNSPVTSTGTLTVTIAGTSGGIPYFNSASTLASSGLLTNHALMLGGGAAGAPTTLGSLGTSTTVLHGNASGNPTFGAVVLSTDVSGNLPNANLAIQTANTVLGALTATTPSGLALPSCSGATNALIWTSGTGFGCNTIPAGTGTVTTSGSPSAGDIATFSSATAITNVAQTGSGSVVRATSPSVSGLTVTGSLTATGLVTNADLVNAATTVNGQSCVLGAACTITAAAGTVTVGTTAIASGTDTRVLFDNAGVLGEYTISGSGNVAMTTSPTIASPTITGAFTATGLVTNADLVSPSITVNGSTCTLGSSCTPIAGGLVIGSTAIGGGTTTRVLYDNGGTLGEYTNTQLTALINSFSTSLSGAAPASGGGTTNFLRADGSWAAPTGSGSVTSVGGSSTGSTLTASGGPVTTTGTLNFELNLSHANTWAAAQSFNSGDLKLNGSGSGATTLNAAATAGTTTITLPGGTTDFSATGGTSQFVKQASAGAAFTVARPACGDLSDSGTSCTKVAPVYGPCLTFSSTLPVTAETDIIAATNAGTMDTVLFAVTGGGSFTAEMQINGTPVTGCRASTPFTVSGTSTGTQTCTAAKTVTKGDQISWIISAPSGTVNTAFICPQINP